MKTTLRTLAALAVSLLMVLGLGAPARAALTYFHATGQQAFTATIPTTSSANLTVWNPTITAGDFHSLGELAAADADQSEAVEVGWRKAAGGVTRLFVYWWLDGAPCGYNGAAGCGVASPWVDNPAVSLNVGDALTTSSGVGTPVTLKVGVDYSTTDCGAAPNGWWVRAWYSTGTAQYIGCFKDTNWAGVSPAFVDIHQVKAYGEVAANVAGPTTQMGSGLCGTVATFNTTGFIGSVQTNLGLASLTYTTTDASKYSLSSVSGSSFYYGGDGSCP